MRDLLVLGCVWLSVSAWFAGAIARDADPAGHTERLYRTFWLFGAILILVHIVASYGFVHGWSHAAALAATADESFEVTGVRASWGVYVNFAFATVWLGYSIAMVRAGGRIARWDAAVFVFTALIVASATVVFERGVIRWAATAGFVAIAVLRCKRLCLSTES